MDILRVSVDWTRAEMVSSSFFVLFGLLLVLGGFGFWQIGKTEMAKAYVLPTCIAGALLLIIGLGIFAQSYGRLTSFPIAYQTDGAAFIASEIRRAEMVMNQYHIAVFRVIPLIIAASAILVVMLESPAWRAALITVIAMMAVIMVVDSNANARLEGYRAVLLEAAR